MVTLDWETARTDGVTLVRLYVTADHRRRVRIANRLDGPVWPPRAEGQPAAGWDGSTFAGVVTPDDRLVTGYATPAPPADPPAEVVADDPAESGATPGPAGRPDTGDAPSGPGTDAVEGGPTPAGVVRSLGDPVVPREAVPVPEVSQASPADEPGGEFGVSGGGGPAESDAVGGRGAFERASDPDGAAAPRTDAALVVPGAVRAWLRDVDRRLAAVERRQRADAVDSDATLQVAVAGDRRALARVTDRVETLVGRAEAVEERARGTGGR